MMRENEDEGLCHTIWSFITPFIGGICNCSLPGCMAMSATLTHRTPVMFRAEYVAVVDEEKCSGCGECVKICPFDAYVPHKRKAKAKVDSEEMLRLRHLPELLPPRRDHARRPRRRPRSREPLALIISSSAGASRPSSR